MKRKAIIESLIAALIVLFAIFMIFQLIKVMFGGSWTSEDLIIGLLIANMSWSFLISYTLWTHIGEHKGYRKAMENMKDGKGTN